jgi:tetratricopeptide (TPR) repeat protein
MPARLKKILVFLSLAAVWGGGLAVTSMLPHPGDLKPPLMTFGMACLALLYLPHLRASRALIPFLCFWVLAYFRLSRQAAFQEAAVAQVGVLLAFLLGYLRAPLAQKWLMPPLVLLCVLRGLLDMLTLSHLHDGPGGLPGGLDAFSAYHATSFFADKQLFGAMLILGAFLHFYLMEKNRDPHRPVQVLLYSSSLLVLLTLLLVDSRLAQGAFFACFLPLLFLSVKLDGREPRLERLAWITGITLSLGLAWINLPEIQMKKMAAALAPSSPGFLPWAWASAWRTWMAAPFFGGGLGGFRFASVPHQGPWPTQAASFDLPVLLHAQNHFLEALAEGGAVYLVLEGMLLLGAAYGLARVYFREWRLEAKYAFFSLASLSLMGCFSPVLEQAPARAAYWALIGYGWSFLAAGLPSRRIPSAARNLAGGALAALACLHLYLRVPELLSEQRYLKAAVLEESDPKGYTNGLVEALRLNPANEDANYGYAQVLSGFGREGDAIKQVEYVQGFARDPKRRDEALARIYATVGKYDSSARYARSMLGWYPGHLPAMEILMDALAHQGRCTEIDSLRAAALALEDRYPPPPSREFTASGLDSLFGSNREVLFVQRWFGGKALRRRFVESRLIAYNRLTRDHERFTFLKEASCSADPGKARRPVKTRTRFLYRGWG